MVFRIYWIFNIIIKMTEKQIEIINNLNENVEKLGNKDFDVYSKLLDKFQSEEDKVKDILSIGNQCGEG